MLCYRTRSLGGREEGADDSVNCYSRSRLFASLCSAESASAPPIALRLHGPPNEQVEVKRMDRLATVPPILTFRASCFRNSRSLSWACRAERAEDVLEADRDYAAGWLYHLHDVSKGYNEQYDNRDGLGRDVFAQVGQISWTTFSSEPSCLR